MNTTARQTELRALGLATDTPLRRFWRDFLKPYKIKFIGITAGMVSGVLLQLPIPLLTMWLVDYAFEKRQLGTVSAYAILLIVLSLTRHVVAFVSEITTLKLREEIIFHVEMKLFRHLQQVPLAFFKERHSVYLQSRLMNDSRAIEGALIRTLVTIGMNTLTFLVGAVVICFLSWQIGLFLIMMLLPFAYVRYYANERMRILSKDMQEKQAQASAMVGESIAGLRTVKTLNEEEHQAATVAEKLAALRDIYVDSNRFGVISTSGTGMIASLNTAFVLWFGMSSVINGSMSIGGVVGILSFLNFLYSPVNVLVAANLNLQAATGAIQRIYEILEVEPESTAGRPLAESRGALELRNVHFSYQPGHPVLRGINLQIEPGEKVALVGRSGAGKSTLVNLLLRFYEPGRDAVFLDGHDIREAVLGDLRKSIGLVDQQTFLFGNTVYENIRYGKADATREQVIEACRQAHAHEFIERLENGYDTRVGERGARLSGGQAQRIALARMFLRNPSVIILDEAVSAVDSESEAAIQEALVNLGHGRTLIIIAHRLSSLMLADRILLLDEGVIKEQGAHDELVSANGDYAQLFQNQFQPQRIESLGGSSVGLATV